MRRIVTKWFGSFSGDRYQYDFSHNLKIEHGIGFEAIIECSIEIFTNVTLVYAMGSGRNEAVTLLV